MIPDLSEISVLARDKSVVYSAYLPIHNETITVIYELS